MSKQSTLGDGPDAADLDAGNRQISVAEFFEKNKHMLGFGSNARAPFTALKEAVDNSLDATEEGGYLPSIYTELRDDGDYFTLIVEDNGPGITREEVPNVFGKLLYGSRFASRSQSRGQQGIGISAAVLYSQLTTGEPAQITSKTSAHDTAQYFELIIDTDSNEPEIKKNEEREWDREYDHGTRIELTLEGNLRSRSRILEYIRLTATVNPHASIEYHGPKTSLEFDRVTDELPPETEEIPPHPHGVELGTLMKMLEDTSSHSLSGFLQTEFTRVGSKTAENILNGFRDRYYGRQPVWKVPDDDGDTELADVIEAAVSNKGAEATREFAEETAAEIHDAEHVSYTDVTEIVAGEADSVENGFTTRFGSTVRKKAATAAWDHIRENRSATFAPLIDDVTTKRKSDETITAIAERLAEKFGTEYVTQTELRKYVESAADRAEDYADATVGDTAREKILDTVWEHFQTVDEDVPKIREAATDRDIADYLLEAMRSTDVIAPPTDCLSPIQGEKLEAGMRDVYDGAEFYTAATRDASVHGGDPFIVEAGIAYGGDLSKQDKQTVNVNRFANRVPLVYQQGACAITDVVKDIGWRNYKLSQSTGKNLPKAPAVITVHVASTNVPFTSESKDALSNVPEIENEIERAVREAARDLKDYLRKQQSLQKRREKREVVGDILPKIERKVTSMVGDERPGSRQSLARIMNNLYIGTDEDDPTTIHIRNYENSGSDRPEVRITVPSQPSVEDTTASTGNVASPDVTDDSDECVVEWSPKIPSGGYASLTLDVKPETVTESELPDEKVTLDTSIEN